MVTMDNIHYSSVLWVLLVVTLFILTFGFHLCIMFPFCLVSFVLGICTVLYFSCDDNFERIKLESLFDNPLESSTHSRSLIQMPPQDDETEPEESYRPMTGNKDVDSFLYEILGFVIRDYVSPWYNEVSEDTHFVREIRTLAEEVVISLSNRIKSTDWMPFFTGSLVEDISCHLRLFRASGASGNNYVSSVGRTSSRGSPARSPARNLQHHKRNKSDTDASVHSSLREYHRNFGESKFYTRFNSQSTVEDRFFQLEYEIEKKKASRKSISTDEVIEELFLNEITQILLYMTVDSNELKARTTQSALRAICCSIIQAAFQYISDPDSINMIIMRMSWRDAFSNESFINSLKTTKDLEELKATLELAKIEVQKLISCDMVGECDISVKQQLSSLQYLIKMLESRSLTLAPTSSNTPAPSTNEVTKIGLDFLLENHLGLGHFLDYALYVGAHSYIPCYLNIQAWKVAVLKYLSPEVIQSKSESCDAKSIKVVAQSIYDQYVNFESPNSLQLPTQIPNKLLSTIKNSNEIITFETMDWFEEVELCIQEKLESLLVGFRESNQYVKLLAELGLEAVYSDNKFGDKKVFGSKSSLNSLTDSKNENKLEHNNLSASQESIEKWITNQEPCFLETIIVETGLTQEHGKWFGIYAIEVNRKNPITGRQYCWHVYRRYSDFYDLHALIKDAFPDLSKLDFPSKKTFHNTSRSVLEQRKVVLNKWLSTLSMLGAPGGPAKYATMHSMFLLPFLRYERQQSVGKIDAMLVQPLKQGMKTLKNVPGHLFSTVDDIVGGLSKALIGLGSSSSTCDTLIFPTRLETSASILEGIASSSDSEELPLRVVLTLLDEVFELKQRNRWLRRQMAALLKQLMTSMFANVLNRKIVEYVSSVASPTTMVYILDGIKYKFWSDEGKADLNNPRSEATKARTRVAVKTFLLSMSQDRLKRIIGSQTTHRGVTDVFQMIQTTTFNKRLLYILLEDLMNTLYPESNMKQVFQQILAKRE